MSNQELLRATIALQESNMGMLEQENEDLRRKLAKLEDEKSRLLAITHEVVE